MASSVISSRLNNIFVRICDAANKQVRINKSTGDSLREIAGNRSPPDFALCEVDLDNKFFRSGDIVVGFRAYTDASFTIVVKDKISIPFTMKAGEFHLAWKNISFIPSICMEHDTVEVKNVRGNVRVIIAHLDIWARRELGHIPEFYLGFILIVKDGQLCESTWIVKDKQLCNAIDVAYKDYYNMREIHTDKCPCVIQ